MNRSRSQPNDIEFNHTFYFAVLVAVGVAVANADYCRLCEDHVACPEDTVSCMVARNSIWDFFFENCSQYFLHFRHQTRIVRAFQKLRRRWKISFLMNTINWEIKLQPVKHQDSSQPPEWQLWWVLISHLMFHIMSMFIVHLCFFSFLIWCFQQWDDELAYLAYFNAKKCSFGHDKCRKTNMFQSAGQNIAGSSVQGTGLTYEKPEDVIKAQTQNWFNEYKYTNPEVIKAYHSTGNP